MAAKNRSFAQTRITGNGVTVTDWLFFAGCAGLLSLERIGYWWIWNNPDRFRHLRFNRASGDGTEPVDRMYRLFLGFKLIQLAVFFGWCMWFGRTWWPMPTAPLPVLVPGALALVIGQSLNFSVFRALGKTGVFYGNRFGHTVPWRSGFPFSLFAHPQYTGTLLSIWGFFAIMRYPAPDWLVLPLLETFYYFVGARLERDPAPGRRGTGRDSSRVRD